MKLRSLLEGGGRIEGFDPGGLVGHPHEGHDAALAACRLDALDGEGHAVAPVVRRAEPVVDEEQQGRLGPRRSRPGSRSAPRPRG